VVVGLQKSLTRYGVGCIDSFIIFPRVKGKMWLCVPVVCGLFELASKHKVVWREIRGTVEVPSQDERKPIGEFPKMVHCTSSLKDKLLA
jgi:hypothetical protein